MQPTEIIITNKLATGTTFAVLASDMTQNVFIPSKLALDASLRPGQKVMAQIVPNMSQPEKTPWLAISLEDAKPLPEQKQSLRDTLGAFILGNLQADGRATVKEIAEDMNMADEKIAAKLAELVAAGRVVRLTCFDLPEVQA
jgi:predicted Rossmann fold nucleotide-binding protein DprA/Smf involved in DNA uptake